MFPTPPPTTPIHPLPHDPIDPETLDILRSELDPEDFIQIIALYLDNLPHRIAAIDTALTNRDGKGLACVAHPLKSSSRQLGAFSLGTLCETLEQAGHTNNLETVQHLLQPLKQAVAAVETTLQQILGEKQLL